MAENKNTVSSDGELEDMMKKKLFKGVCIAAGLLLILILYVVYVFVSYYRLDDNLKLDITTNTGTLAQTGKTYRISSYNIGFGAYSDDYSFFMDGGTESRARSAEAVHTNITGSAEAAEELNSDIMLFQEVDIDGTRSHHVNEKELLLKQLNSFGITEINYVFAQNYDSPYLFYPILEPHGKNKSGILTISNMGITSSIRRSLPIEEGFTKLLDLDRCYVKNRISVENGRELILYNLHLSAYTSDPSTAEKQLDMLFQDMTEEYNQGNYIVAGGDFNKDLLGNSAEIFGHEELDDNWAKPIPEEMIPGNLRLVAPFHAENPVPSCRNADQPYNEESFVVTVDGFLVSDNVTVKDANTVDTRFKWSDHNPVFMDFELD